MFNKKQAASAEQEDVGHTQIFVTGKGFVTVDGFDALIGHDDTNRLFIELTADPDRPEVRPSDAYQAILHSMQPGWTIRMTQAFWPDPAPRQRFFEMIQGWPKPTSEGNSILLDGLKLAVQENGIPYTRKTIIEFVSPGSTGTPWWQSVPEMFSTFGIRARYMTREDIEALSHWILNPSLL